MTDTTKESQSASVALQTAHNTAKVAGVFALIFLGLLAANWVTSTVISPRRENTLAAMKTKLLAAPDDETLRAEVRRLDLRIRHNRMWRLAFARKAGYALLGSVVIFLIASKLADLWRREAPRPGSATDHAVQQVREARSSRWSVVFGLFAVAGGGALLAMSQGPLAFVQVDQEAGPAYATMEQKSEQWHRFRGPGGSGVSPMANAPTAWDGESGEGILWKTPVPLPGRNSPVVWGNRVFLAGATEAKREVFCYDADSGQLLWRGDVPTSPAVAEVQIEVMEDTGYSASTTATDGRRIYAIFPNGDVAAFDFNGRRLWNKNLGIPESMYGYASSLETYADRVIIQYDQGYGDEGLSRLYALDGRTGNVVWEAPREVPNSWTSPIVVDVEGALQLITLTDPWLIGYDPDTGAEIWRADCASGDVAPSPVYAGGLVFAIEPYSRVVAVRPTGHGDVTETHIAWESFDSGPDICCPVSDGQYLYVLDSGGLMICCDVADGAMVYEHDFGETFMASPSIAGGKLYVLDENGVMSISRIGPEYQEIATCELGEMCFASPAFVDGRIYIRSEENLYCIGPAASDQAVE